MSFENITYYIMHTHYESTDSWENKEYKLVYIYTPSSQKFNAP